jgi:hypothetical protein
LLVAMISLPVIFFSRCMHSPGTASTDLRGEEYAGPAACISCHKNIYDSFQNTAHDLTSRAASRQTVQGSFTPPDNRFLFRPGMQVTMEQRDSGLFEVATTDGRQEAHRFDIVVGSGRKAQTFLYWAGDEPRQLPISYFVTAHAWANSPDFPSDRIWFGRTIPSRCFECHASAIQKKEPLRTDAFHQIDQFDRAHILYGIDCERCHGPGAGHVRYQQEHPDEKRAYAIMRYADMSRQQKLDMCAVCHSGTHEMQRSAFDFRPGDTLSYFYYPQSDISGTAAKMDVHGNQYQLLIASQCFLQSRTLVCGSCHDVHVKERDRIAAFSSRCMNCHRPETANFCKMAPALGTAAIVNNCIDCHMPLKASRVITLQTGGLTAPTPNLVRNHLIAVYPEETKKFLATRPELARTTEKH